MSESQVPQQPGDRVEICVRLAGLLLSEGQQKDAAEIGEVVGNSAMVRYLAGASNRVKKLFSPSPKLVPVTSLGSMSYGQDSRQRRFTNFECGKNATIFAVFSTTSDFKPADPPNRPCIVVV